MKAYLIKYYVRLLLFLTPFVICFLAYVIIDPFMVIYQYDDFNKRSYIGKNRDYISTEMLMSNSQKYTYDSFILGSSTALSFAPSIWKDFIDTDNNVYTFDASGENIVGIWSKIKYLHSNGYQLRNVLLVLENNDFVPFVNDVPIFMKHTGVYPSSRFAFHYAFFLSSVELKFVTAVAVHLVSGRFYPFMNDILVPGSYNYDPITNEFYNTGLWDAIKKDSVRFYVERASIFPLRTGEYAEDNRSISDQHRVMLEEIKNIFDDQGTSYRILISPALKQVSFNKDDLSILKNIFREEYVFDFTGINEFTESIADYTDATHFKRSLAKRMLKIVYFQPEDKNIFIDIVDQGPIEPVREVL